MLFNDFVPESYSFVFLAQKKQQSKHTAATFRAWPLR